MGRKNKYTKEQKVKACEDYLTGKKSAIQIAQELNMGKSGKSKVYFWIKRYQSIGDSAFDNNSRNKSYSKEFKMMVINEYLSGKESMETLSIKYNIPSKETVRGWIMKYNNHIEIKDYDPRPEVYMADTKKTTFEERKEIVNWCLENGRSFKEAAAHFGCSYMQVRNWVLKYENDGEDGLLDRRGKRKQEEQLTELEKAQRRIKQLEREKKEFREKYEFLKKVEETERW